MMWPFSEKKRRRQRETEAALRESEEKYRQLVENANDLIFRTDPAGNLTYVNARCQKVLEYPREKLLGMHYLQVVRADHRETVEAFYLRQRIEKTANTYHECPVISRTGKTIWLGQNVQLITKNDRTYRFQVVARDISDRKKMEKDLRRSEERYRLLVENTMDGYFVCDIPSGRYEFLNQQACEMFGYRPEEALKLTLWDTSAEEDHARIRRKVQGRLDGSYLDPGHAIYTARRKDGSTFRAEVSASLVNYRNRPAIQGIVRDVTERERLERQLRQAQRMESIGTLAGGVAHDFNNILSPIIGYTELSLDELPEGNPVRGNLLEVLQAADRAKSLVRQILTFSRMADQELKPLKIQSIIKEVLKLVRSSLPSTIEIHQEINDDCRPVMADATQIHQMVMNLITNAYHAMEESGGRLEISLEEIDPSDRDAADLPPKAGRYLCLKVADTGVGMDKAVMERIYEPYFTTKEKDKGTGLGLSMVHGIVKSCRGSISVSSEPGRGSSFSVYLPILKTTEKLPERTALSEIRKGHEHILLIDDEVEIVRMEKRMLRKLGYRVTEHSSSTGALAAFSARSDDFDLVITDLTMPVMTGDKLSEELTAIRSDIPVIICTGFSESIDELQQRSTGIRALLMKPVVMRDLADTIRDVLDKERAAG
jgi:PAS domain S-box-containing protein